MGWGDGGGYATSAPFLSDVLSEEGAQAYLELVPHSEYSNVGEAAHMVAGDRNDIFVSSVLSFLSKVAPPN